MINAVNTAMASVSTIPVAHLTVLFVVPTHTYKGGLRHVGEVLQGREGECKVLQVEPGRYMLSIEPPQGVDLSTFSRRAKGEIIVEALRQRQRQCPWFTEALAQRFLDMMPEPWDAMPPAVDFGVNPGLKGAQGAMVLPGRVLYVVEMPQYFAEDPACTAMQRRRRQDGAELQRSALGDARHSA